MTPELRPLTAGDASQVQPLAARAFDDLAVRQGRPPRAAEPATARYYARVHEHLLRTGRGVGAYDGDQLVGVALSYVRDQTWVLALLVVEPGRQSAGAGSALLRASLSGAPPVRLLHSSRDARAMRAYAQAGFRLLPALMASGQPEVTAPAARHADLDADGGACPHLVDDLRVVVDGGGQVLELADGRPGLALAHGPEGSPHAEVLGAPDPATAQDLLRVALAAAAGRGGPVEVGPLAPQEHWAVDVVLEAGLELAVCGPVAVAGLADPLSGTSPPGAVFV